MNPLLSHYETEFAVPPFHLIKDEHYLPALEKEIEIALAKINKIIKEEKPNFKNTVEALEFALYPVATLSELFGSQNLADGPDTMKEIAKIFNPKSTAFFNEVLLNGELFEVVKHVYNNQDKEFLTPDAKRLLKHHYKNFVRQGALLDQKRKDEVKKIDEELSKLTTEFGDNVLAETNDYKMVITDEKELEGLPEGAIMAAKEAAREKGTPHSWVFTLYAPSYLAFMKYAKNRNRRKELYLAFGKRGAQKNKNDNQENILKIVRLRDEKAKILGYKNFAALILEERMAKTVETVINFEKDFLAKAKPFAKKDIEEVASYAKKVDGITDLAIWDFSYYSEKLKMEKFSIDDEVLKPYFSLERTLNGFFLMAHKLYDLTFIPRKDLPTYHPDAMPYEVKIRNRHLGVIYCDFFPRETKRQGAWMTAYRNQHMKDGADVRPHVAIVCNFTKPIGEIPSLLTFQEVKTLFHEMGHALHGLLSECKYPSLSGTSVFWDFVELPSQIMENWCEEKEALDLFARHYKTGEPIPMEYLKKIQESSSFQEAYMTMRQLSFGFVDMAWHTTDKKISDVTLFEREAIKETMLFPLPDGVCFSTSFTHIFQGGYAAGYYSYKWAEVLDADAFEFFKERGIFNKEVAESFKDNVLSRGGSEDPDILFERFRGRKPSVDPLLRRAGLIA